MACVPEHDARDSDLAPPRSGARAWHDRVVAATPDAACKRAISAHLRRWHPGARGRLSDTVAGWRAHALHGAAVSHPSSRNRDRLRHNRGLGSELLPALHPPMRHG